MSHIMAIFETPGMTAEQYDRVDTELKAIGMTKPDGRLFHVATPIDGGWLVTDIWQSTELLDQFSKVLVPILEANGIPAVQPKIYPVYNLITR